MVPIPATTGHMPLLASHLVAVPRNTTRAVSEITIKGENDIGCCPGIHRPDDNPGLISILDQAAGPTFPGERASSHSSIFARTLFFSGSLNISW